MSCFLNSGTLCLLFSYCAVYLQKMEEDGFTSIEDSLRGAGILGAKDNPIAKSDPRNPPDSAIDVTVHGGARFSINLNMPTKKVCPYS